MRLKLFPDKELYYDTLTKYLECSYQHCDNCPFKIIQDAGLNCKIAARERVIRLLLKNIQGLIKLL